jgi:endoglucanase
MADALKILNKNNPNTDVYVDAGNPTWNVGKAKGGPATETARALKNIDPDGKLVLRLAITTSNYHTPAQSQKYARKLNAALGRHLPVMIDVGRSGAQVPDPDNFCNNEHARVGQITLGYYVSGAKVNVAWVKEPGVSDGDCGPGRKAAGTFDADLLATQLGFASGVYKR